MPEMKRTFTSGKMNKDLDERLVPNGEYRDAMNIQVSTSEGSNVGTVQNILGNFPGCNYDSSINPIPTGSTVVGSVSDEKNDSLYWFITGANDVLSLFGSQTGLPIDEVVTVKDMIMRTTVGNPTGCEPVFVDKHGWCIGVDPLVAGNTMVGFLTFNDSSLYSNITPGMQVTSYGGFSGRDNIGPVGSGLVTHVGQLSSLPHINYQSGGSLVLTAQPDVIFSGGGTSQAVGGLHIRTFDSYLGTKSQTNNTHSYRHIAPSPTLLSNNWFNLPNLPAENLNQFWISDADWDASIVVGSVLTNITNNLTGNTILNGPDATIVDIQYHTICTNNGSNSGCFQAYVLTIDTGLDGNGNYWGLATLDLTIDVHPSQGNFAGEAHSYVSLDATITPPGVNSFIPNSTIHLSPNSQNWLNDVYNILYDSTGALTGNELQIDNSVGAGSSWPNFSCIDPASVIDDANFNPPFQYDNEFNIIECLAGANPGAAVTPFNNNPSWRPLTFGISGGGGIDAVWLHDDININDARAICFTSERVLEFDPDNLITGVNIIDDMLFWTDNFTEPKKINIPRSIQGTDQNGDIHTKLINSTTNSSDPVRKEHVTVIKKGPKSALSMDLISQRDADLNYSGIITISDADNLEKSTLWGQRQAWLNGNTNLGFADKAYDFSLISTEEGGNTFKVIIKSDLYGNVPFELNTWKVGSKVVLKEFDKDGEPPSIPITDYTIKGTIIKWEWTNSEGVTADVNRFVSTGQVYGAKVSIKVNSISRTPQSADPTTGMLNYGIDLFDDPEDKLFEFKFPRFSYRYKYEDGEYSTFAPWSNVAFLSSGFDYHPKKGYNLGMTNRISKLYLKDFITDDIPLDVVEIDLLYKEESSPNIYIIETIKSNSEPTITDDTGIKWNHWSLNEFLIDKELFKSILPSNQLLRPWDNVPKTALAQEVTGNRIVYGNYKQNYNMEIGAAQYNPTFSHTLVHHPTSVTSIKSLRDYQLGVVFTDKYGRETPVISNSTGTFKVDKDQSVNKNKLQLSINSAVIPPNMEYFKFYIKETSGEYYNMAMDRYWDAEDGNVWVSFASTDRNKIDIDSFLILKKGVDSNKGVAQKAKFKVVAIENEAPDFIKTKKTIISDIVHYDSDPEANIFRGSQIPKAGESDFTIAYWDGGESKNVYSNSVIKNLHNKASQDGDIYFQMQNNLKTSQSTPIKIAEIDIEDDNWNNEDGEGSFTSDLVNWKIRLEEPFGNDIDQFTNSDGGNGTIIENGNRAVFWSYKKENSPEFDGRFFVKIYRDETFDENIVNNSTAAVTDFTIKVTQKIYRFDKAKHGKVFLNMTGVDFRIEDQKAYTDTPWEADSTWPTIPNWEGYFTQTTEMGTDWDLGGNSGDSWIEHAAFFRGINIHKAMSSNSDNFNHGAHGINHRKDFETMDLHAESAVLDSNGDSAWTTADWEFEDVWFIDGEISNGEHSGVWGESYTDNDHIGSGLNVGNGYLELGFGGIQPQNNQASEFSWFWGYGMVSASEEGWREDAGGSFYNLSNNDHYNGTASNLAEELGLGVVFRWKQDPTQQVFVINDIRDFNLLRHESGDRAPGLQMSGYAAPDPTPASSWGRVYRTSTFYRPDNYTKNYKLTFTDFLNPGAAINWNPYDIGQILNGVRTTLVADGASSGPHNNIITVDSLIGTGGTETTYGNKRVEVGMCVWKITHTDAGGSTTIPNTAIISKIDGNKLYLKHYHPANYDTAFPAAADDDVIHIRQQAMNGLSRNSVKNINYWNEASGFENTNPGVGAVGYDIEILEPVVTEALFPRFPAVFETEPKEAVELDVYYEITDNNPTSLNIDTIKSILPIGSFFDIQKVDIEDDLISGGASFIRQPAYISSHLPTAQGIIASEDLANFNLNSGDKLIVKKANGDTVSVEIQAIGPANDGTLRSVLFLRPNLVNQEIISSWSNCYSFGNGVESNRVRDGFNQTYISNGVKASTTLPELYKEEERKYGLIYSGIYNSTSGINNLNQFIAAEKITKEINSTYGSIQKLHSRSTADGDLIALCEDRVLKILANKDALYNADGKSQLTATDNVLGQAVPFSGEYGISNNPESFASEAYRVYFTDKVRGAVMRLSKDGLTPISDHGMKNWFKTNLKLSHRLIGSHDDKKSEYNITLKGIDVATTVSFKEDVKGWVSFKSFVPENAISCANEYYTFKDGNLWVHHSNQSLYINSGYITSDNNTFYGAFTPTSLKVILNDAPSVVKTFHTLNYEGSQSNILQSLAYNTYEPGSWDGTEYTVVQDTYSNNEHYNLQAKLGWYAERIQTNKETGEVKEFIEKEGKWFNYIKGITPSTMSEFGQNGFDSADSSFQGLGMLAGSTPYQNLGCTDISAINYNPLAIIDDGSCCHTAGCTNPIASNYDATVCFDNGSCIFHVPGCTNDSYTEYDSNATLDDGSCVTEIKYGCTDNTFTSYYGIQYANSTNYNTDSSGNTVIYTAPCYEGNGPACVTDELGVMQVGLNCCCIPLALGCTDATASNYDPTANTSPTVGPLACVPYIYGCMNSNANNYDSTATASDGNCTFNYGCTDATASNYDASAYYDDGSCVPFIDGCMNSNMFNYNSNANTQCASCCVPFVSGCTDSTAIGGTYDPTANDDDGSCCYNAGCMDSSADNFDGTACYDDGNQCVWQGCMDTTTDGNNNYGPSYSSTYNVPCNSTGMPGDPGYDPASDNDCCDELIWGCTDNTMFGYDPTANMDDGSCAAFQQGCMESLACNYSASANVNIGCEYTSCAGCTDPTAVNYDAAATIDDGNCEACIYGCMDEAGVGVVNYAPNATCEATTENPGIGICIPIVLGCIDPAADNYDATANIDNATCLYSGCTDNNPNTNGGVALNYDPNANVDDGSCTYPVYGCTDPASLCNYDPTATNDNNSCGSFFGCADPLAANYDSSADICHDATQCSYIGCTDPTATNYDPNANVDDSTCAYTGYYAIPTATINPSNTATNGMDFSAELYWDEVPGCATNGYAVHYSGVGPGFSCISPCQAVSSGVSLPPQSPSINVDWRVKCPAVGGFGPVQTVTLLSGNVSGSIPGCTDSNAYNYDSAATIYDGSCLYTYGNQTAGCTDITANNYDISAVVDDGSCTYDVLGCTDSTATNYDPLATADDGSCIVSVYGCMVPAASNYDATANNNTVVAGTGFFGCNYGGNHQYNYPVANTSVLTSPTTGYGIVTFGLTFATGGPINFFRWMAFNSTDANKGPGSPEWASTSKMIIPPGVLRHLDANGNPVLTNHLTGTTDSPAFAIYFPNHPTASGDGTGYIQQYIGSGSSESDVAFDAGHTIEVIGLLKTGFDAASCLNGGCATYEL